MQVRGLEGEQLQQKKLIVEANNLAEALRAELETLGNEKGGLSMRILYLAMPTASKCKL